MKKILVTVVLGVAASVATQSAAQPAQPPSQPAAQSAQGQPPASTSQAPVIKDPAEYNAYVGAIQQKDPTAQISGLEAFMTQYPNSVMKVAALQTLMQDYERTGNQQKTIEAATKLLAADPNSERALFLLAYFDRMKAQGGDANAKQDLVDAKKYGEMGLQDLPKFTKPEGTSDADFQKMKDQMTGVFNAAIGISEITDKDYDDARKRSTRSRGQQSGLSEGFQRGLSIGSGVRRTHSSRSKNYAGSAERDLVCGARFRRRAYAAISAADREIREESVYEVPRRRRRLDRRSGSSQGEPGPTGELHY